MISRNKYFIRSAICIAILLSFRLGQLSRPTTTELPWYDKPPPKAILRGVKIVPVDQDFEVGGIFIVTPLSSEYVIDINKDSEAYGFMHDCYVVHNKDEVGIPFEDRWYTEL